MTIDAVVQGPNPPSARLLDLGLQVVTSSQQIQLEWTAPGDDWDQLSTVRQSQARQLLQPITAQQSGAAGPIRDQDWVTLPTAPLAIQQSWSTGPTLSPLVACHVQTAGAATMVSDI